MSIHSSLKMKSGSLNQHRNVLTRAERISKLSSVEKFDMAKDNPLGLVKVRSIKVTAGKKEKKKVEGEGDAAAPAAGAKPAAGAAKPAAGAAKPAAGAAKPAAKPAGKK
jgi:small basic protein (TIGR04137 family)